MSVFLTQTLRRNPVWMIPVALPFAVYASSSLSALALFSVLFVTVLPAAEALAALVEPSLPRSTRRFAPLMIAAVLVTVVEIVLVRVGGGMDLRTLLFLRALPVCTTTLSSLPRRETGPVPIGPRVVHTFAGALGIALGTIALAAVRLPLAALGVDLLISASGAFLVLAAGRSVINVATIRRERSR